MANGFKPTHDTRQLNWLLVWAVVFCDIGTSVYYVPGILYGHVRDATPYWYAEEMLAEGRGALVPFRDPAALAEQVINLLDNEAKRHAMRKQAYLFGRAMIWPKVARCYMESFDRARTERRHFTPLGFTVKALDERPGELPPPQTRSLTPHDGRYRHIATRHFRGAQLS